MKKFVLMVGVVALLILNVMTFTACDKFQGKTFEFQSVAVTYITEVDENGLVTKTETLSIDDYIKNIMGITDIDARWAKMLELQEQYGVRENYYKFSNSNSVQDIFSKTDEVTGATISEVKSLTYKLEGDAIQITRSELDENGCGFMYTERLEIITSSQLQKYFWGGVNSSSRFSAEDANNHAIYRLVVSYMSY